MAGVGADNPAKHELAADLLQGSRVIVDSVAQAATMGDRRKARAVGAANGRNPIPIVVPCHRVVGSNGHLTGFAGGIEVKAWLLDHELRVRAR